MNLIHANGEDREQPVEDSDNEYVDSVAASEGEEAHQQQQTQGPDPVIDNSTRLPEAISRHERTATPHLNYLGIPVNTQVEDSDEEDMPPPLYSTKRKRVRSSTNNRNFTTNASQQHYDTYPHRRTMEQFLPEHVYGHAPQLKVETYSGEDDWEAFISHFDACSRLGNWSPQTKCLTLLASMRGQAQRFILNLRESDKNSYTQMVNKLARRFGKVQQTTLWMTKLENRKREPGESIAALADDIRRLTRKAYAHLDAKHRTC